MENEAIKKMNAGKTTITLSYRTWKRLQLKKLHENFATVEDVIVSMLNKEEATK